MTHVDEIAIAALLHDIDQLHQGADTPRSATGGLLAQMRSKLPADLDTERIERLAVSHHRPAQPDEWILAEADRLASGQVGGPEPEHPGSDCGREVALRSVLAAACLDGDPPTANSAPHWRPRPLHCDQRMLPDASSDGEMISTRAAVADAVQEYLGAATFHQLSTGNAVRAVLGFSERFQGLLAASAMDRSDVSLHDHAVVTAALASSMSRWHELQDDLAQATVCDRETVKYRFVVGSLGGIQRFIFNLPESSQKGIARTFRAKSFYVAALAEAVVQRLLDAASLPPTNAVLNAGGRFVLLVDASEITRSRLQQEAVELQHWFMENHLGLLSLRLDEQLTASGEDLVGGRFGDMYRRIEIRSEASRHRIGAGPLQRQGAWQCEQFLRSRTNAQRLVERQMDEARRIGRVLPRSSQFAFFEPKDAPQGLLDRPVDCCGLPLQLGSPSQPIDVSGARKAVSLTDDAQPSWLPLQPLANYIPSLSREDSRRLVDQGWGDEDEPAGPGDTATFGHLAALSQRETPDGRLQGRPMLACLKADVDRLGMLFSRGFGRNVSFGRIASLSRLLDRFFQGFLPSQFAQEGSPFRHVYTVFSGGDDLMLIGPWPTMFDLAPRIPAWLDELSGSNPDITLSAALVLGNPRTPPTVLAELGDEQLDRAKEAGRNKVSVFGRLLSWPQLRGALDAGRRLDAMLQDAAPGLKLNTSFVYRVLTHARAAERVAIAAENHRPVVLRDVTWRSHLLYDIHRNIEEPLGDRATSQQREELAWLKSLLYVGMNASDLSAAVVAVTYALYMNRGS